MVASVFDLGGGETTAAWVFIRGASDIGRAVEASSQNHSFVVVECQNWKVIPLENLVAEFRKRQKMLYAFVAGSDDIRLAFAVLEKGVDGVVIPPESLEEAKSLLESSAKAPRVELSTAKVTRITDAGVGERVCVDTISQLSIGEGMLIGSKASFFFLVHGETVPTVYIPTRPFRVNAGAIHSYLLVGEDRTRYLSELESGDRVLLANSRGDLRETVVGRVKIERRSMVLVEADSGGEKGSVILQNAETIRLVTGGGGPVPVTELRQGDEVLVKLTATKGRHFGGDVDEYIIEK